MEDSATLEIERKLIIKRETVILWIKPEGKKNKKQKNTPFPTFQQQRTVYVDDNRYSEGF